MCTTLLSTLYPLSHQIHSINLCGKLYYYSDFTDEESEPLEGKANSQGLRVNTHWNWAHKSAFCQNLGY